MWLFNKQYNSAEPIFADDELISRYRASGDTRYIGTLFTRYTHLVYGVCLKYLQDKEDARDAVMDIFEDLIQNLHSHNIETFKNWLYTVSKNHCLMILRKEASVEKVKKQWVVSLSEEIMDSGDVLHLDTYELDNRLSKMMDALRRLSEEQRTCLELLYLHNKSYQEVSDMTGYSMNQVKSFIQNGKRNMKNLLVKEYG